MFSSASVKHSLERSTRYFSQTNSSVTTIVPNKAVQEDGQDQEPETPVPAEDKAGGAEVRGKAENRFDQG